MFSVKVKVFTPPSVPLVGDSPHRMFFYPLPSTRPFKRARDVTALQCSEPLHYKRLADHQRSSPSCAGWNRLGTTVNSLQFIFGGFDDKLQIYCEFLGILEYAHRHSPINGLC